ncbi:MAG: arsenate reductase family protein [Erysipelotrichaceae bacterium]|nr:arsenate reductase family protein [Erysipelotrichaceae bacterium]
MLFICYPNCSTCKKAQKWLDDNGFKYELRDIKKDNPKKEELENWHHRSEKTLKAFFNTSGEIYRSLQLKDRLLTMDKQEQFDLLATNGMLVKRPILVVNQNVLVGFKEREWEEVLKR